MNAKQFYTPVDTVYTIEIPQNVYNFEVRTNHNYYVGITGLLVHNGIPCGDKLNARNSARKSLLEQKSVNYKVKNLNSLDDAVREVELLLQDKIKRIKKIYPDAKIGYRGSLATGVKYKTGQPFNPKDWDVDAFIISDNAFGQFASGIGWKDLRKLGDEFGVIADDIEAALTKFSGYRLELDKPFTFRVWRSTDLNYLTNNGCKFIIP
jgi:hypothetical protein